MTLIPDKNLYLVTSALRPLTGVWSVEQRFNQTVQTLKTIKERDKNSVIIFTDASVNPVPKMEMDIIAGMCEIYYDMSQNQDVKVLSSNRLQSMAETVLLLNTLFNLKQQPVLKTCKRIFKVSGRTILENGFDPESHNEFGKYIFKTRIPTWMNPIQHGADNLLITRMYSFCPSLIDNYMSVLQNSLGLLQYMDFEHAHYVNIPKEYLLEFDQIHCWGWLSGGKIEHY